MSLNEGEMKIKQELTGVVKKGKTLLMVVGIFCIVLGMIAIGAPFLVGAMISTVLGKLLVAAGIAEFINAFKSDGKKGMLVIFDQHGAFAAVSKLRKTLCRGGNPAGTGSTE